ncbi:hypothetical protein SPRG_18935, partial [Saprolegnia parasitica CBS 223.65]
MSAVYRIFPLSTCCGRGWRTSNRLRRTGMGPLLHTRLVEVADLSMVRRVASPPPWRQAAFLHVYGNRHAVHVEGHCVRLQRARRSCAHARTERRAADGWPDADVDHVQELGQRVRHAAHL